MEQIIGFCGIICTECPAFIATRTDDDDARQKCADTWSKEFNTEIKVKEINCDGCHATTGILFNHCQICEIRKCGLEKEIETCGNCETYGCEKITSFHKLVPKAKETLDKIHESK